MFKCGFCERTTEPGEGSRTIVTEWRKKSYPSVSIERKPGDMRSKFSPAGEGYEAAATSRACPTCVADGRAQDAPRPEIQKTFTAPVREYAPHEIRRPHYAGRPA